MNRADRRRLKREVKRESQATAADVEKVLRDALRELTLSLFEVAEPDLLMKPKYPEGVMPWAMGELVAKIVKKHAGAKR